MSDDEEFNEKAHKNLLQAISSLGKSQHIRKSTRSEPKQQQDEFQLVKGGWTKNTTLEESLNAVADTQTSTTKQHVGITDIVDILQKTKSDIDVGNKLKIVKQTKKVLEKPLEKPAAQRIKRTIGYENVKEKLARWDAVVAKNRSAETQVFPLNSETIYINTFAHSKPLLTTLKSNMALEMQAAETKLRTLQKLRSGDNVNEQELEKREMELLKKKLTRDELRERRKEMAYLKMRESQKSAKARMKNKIKSKKYHKLLKRQKIQEQIKQFELLQKTNPEAAIEKLNELEKSRVLERASLRHKNTGTWAKNLQVRAKYDKDVRKDLAEQLGISRQLTEKKNDPTICDDHDDDDIEMNENNANEESDIVRGDDPFNPWTKVGSKTMSSSRDGGNHDEKENWRKYWLERNNNQKLLETFKDNNDQDDQDDQEIDEQETVGEPIILMNEKMTPIKQEKPLKSNKQKSKSSTKVENGWIVENLDPTVEKSSNIDEIFDTGVDRIQNRLNKKLKALHKEAKRLQAAEKKTNKKNAKASSRSKDVLKNLKDLSFKQDAKRPIIDDELNQDNNDLNVNNNNNNNALKDTIPNRKTDGIVAANGRNVNGSSSGIASLLPSQTVVADGIDPNKLTTVKLKQRHLNTLQALDDGLEDIDYVDNDDENNLLVQQQMTITEAFEDDDIVADFTKDKTKDSELKNTEIQLSMPGWGSWAGAGISDEMLQKRQGQRNQRLLLKLVAEEKRRDQNKNGLYINEEANEQLRTHLVSDIPFPFTSLQDYEASIRAPIGRSFLPETAHRLLTRPAVITRKGVAIDPMDESELIKRERKPRAIVDKRIHRLAATKKTPGKFKARK